jgi:hypothetical protein
MHLVLVPGPVAVLLASPLAFGRDGRGEGGAAGDEEAKGSKSLDRITA